jgi:hypothetical protein
VQSTRNRVSAAAELAAGVENREYHLDSGFSLSGVHIDRDSAAVIDTANGTIRKNRDLNERAVASKRFVHGIIDDFVNKMVQTALASRPDIHSGTLANGFETLEDLDISGPVFVGVCLRF